MGRVVVEQGIVVLFVLCANRYRLNLFKQIQRKPTQQNAMAVY
jgi:hypothetical protein